MRKFIVTIPREKRFDAGPKARQDAENIALACGFEGLPFCGAASAEGSLKAMPQMLWSTLKNIFRLLKKTPRGSLVVFQYPHYPVKSALLWRWAFPCLRKVRGLRFVALVHDLNSMRGLMGWGAAYADQHFLPCFDRIICHNDAMKRYLMRQGVQDEKLIALGIFDYLAQGEKVPVHAWDQSVAIAGNLSKSAYVKPLLELCGNQVPLHLYGNGGEKLGSNGIWHGAFPPDELPDMLEGGFGLVWDGDRTDHCTGLMGAYLRLNAPHKLSLYLRAGMPVIIWEQAAMAKFVQEENAGLTIGDLAHLPELVQSVSAQEYARMAENARRVGDALRRGEYLSAALQKAAE